MMKIILLYDFDLSLSKGYSINERESARSLKKMLGDQIIIVAPKPEFPEIMKDTEISYYYNHKKYNSFHYLISLFSCYRILRKIIKENKIDAIVTRLPLIPIVPYFFQKLHVPVILKKLAGFSIFESDQRGWKKKLFAALTKPLYRSVIQNCLGADVESHIYVEWAHSTFEISKEKLKMIPNGVNTDSFIPYIKKEMKKEYGFDQFRYLIGYVGAIDSLRHVTLAIESMRILLETMPNTSMVFVGKGSSIDEIYELIRKYNLEDHIFLTGFLPYEKIPRIISAFDIAFDLTYVPLQLPQGVMGASYSQKIPQYLSCGVPVVAWDTQDTQFIKQEGVGSIVPYGSVEGLVKEFQKLLKDQQENSTIECRKCAVNQYSADAISSKRMFFWKQLITNIKTF